MPWMPDAHRAAAPPAPGRPDGRPLHDPLPGYAWAVPTAEEADYGSWTVLSGRHGFASGDVVHLERFGPTLFIASETWSIDIRVDAVVALTTPDALWIGAGTRRMVLAPLDGQDMERLARSPW